LKDPLLLSFTGGVLGTLVDEVIHWLAVWLKLAQTTTGHYLSQLIFPHQHVTLPKLLMGEFTHILAGGTLGIVVFLILELSGYDYLLIKGGGFGAIMWIFHVAIIPNLIAPRPFIFRTFNEAVIDLATHMVWGIIAAWFINITQNKKSNKNVFVFKFRR